MFALIIQYRRLSLCLLLAGGILSACSSSRRAVCELSLSNAPEIRGLRLGMPLEAFKERFLAARQSTPSIQPSGLTPDKDGVIAVSGIDIPEKSDRARIGQILFVDGRVTHFRVIYENYTDQFSWESVDQFVDKTARALGLPATWKSIEELQLKENAALREVKYDLLGSTARTYEPYWHPVDRNEAQRFLLCNDILISAGVPSPGKQHWTNGAFVQFDDLIALRKVKERREARRASVGREEGEQREAFRP